MSDEAEILQRLREKGGALIEGGKGKRVGVKKSDTGYISTKSGKPLSEWQVYVMKNSPKYAGSDMSKEARMQEMSRDFHRERGTRPAPRKDKVKVSQMSTEQLKHLAAKRELRAATKKLKAMKF